MTGNSASRIPHLAFAIAEKRSLHACPRQLSLSPKPFILKTFPSRSAQCFTTTSTAKQNTRAELARKYWQETRRAAEAQIANEPPAPEGLQHSRFYRFVAGAFTIFLGGYITFVYTAYRNDVKRYEAREDKLETYQDVSDRWHNEQRDFDQEVEMSERMMFLRAKRKRLIREAYGDVLEVSCGTGRNMELYDTRPFSEKEDKSLGRDRKYEITSLTFNDQSPVMVQRAKEKWIAQQRKKSQPDRFDGPVYFAQGDAGKPGTVPRPAGGYDTIVQSMGICSMVDPVSFLQQLGRLVRQPNERIQNTAKGKANKEDDEELHGGRIFLLEHGRGYFDWLNNLLDGGAPMHADRYGCWPNKDIEEVIKDSKLVVERVRRYYFGTIWEIVLRPSPVAIPLPQVNIEERNEEHKAGEATKGWFSAWWT